MIRASYAEMKSAANEIRKSSEEYKSNVENLYHIVDNLVNNWKGSDNVSYANTVNNYKNDLKSLGDVVNDYAMFLDKAADTIRATQDEISGAASNL